MNINNNRGVAFIFTLFIMIVLLGVSSVFVLRSISESQMVVSERERTKAFYISEGAAQSGLEQLDTLINTYMQDTISQMNPPLVVNAVNTYLNQANPDGVAFLAYAVQDNGTPVLTLNGAEALYSSSGSLGNGTYDYTIHITEKGNPTCASTSPCNMWDFPYDFSLNASGSSKGQSKKITLTGDFTVRIQRDNFAKYALFTNEQQMPSGTNVWFKNTTTFAGPLFTNGRFNFFGNPAGVFDGEVGQVEQTARFYNNGSSVLLDDSKNGTIDVPTFNDTFDRDQDPITLTSPSQETDMIKEATGNQSFSSNGIYVPNNGSAVVGGIYIKGDSNISLSVNSGNPVYTITQGSTTKTITVNYSTNQTSVKVGSTTTTYAGLPDGINNIGTIIYANGTIDSLEGTVQKDTEVTISSKNNITITNHLEYADYNAAVGTPGTSGYIPPNASGKKNILGLVAWNGDVNISTGAPNNVNVHGTVLAKNGIFAVNNYDDAAVGPRGIATLLGGAITDHYGAFGQFNGSTGAQTAGYGRNFVYDTRMAEGSSPPYFPTLNTFIAFTNNILTPRIIFQEG